MSGGTIIAAALGFGFIAMTLRLIADAQDAVREEEAFGDIVELPSEAKQRTAKDSPGGGAGNAARAQFAPDIAHRNGGVTR